jgi:hypothetical protein
MGRSSMRKWVCSKEGFKRTSNEEDQGSQRQQRSITRCGCQAFLRVKLDNPPILGLLQTLNLHTTMHDRYTPNIFHSITSFPR